MPPVVEVGFEKHRLTKEVAKMLEEEISAAERASAERDERSENPEHLRDSEDK